jgi:uncharacterized protein (DUF302 family)
MSQDSFSIQTFEAKRVQYETTRSFDEVLQNIQKLVGTSTDHQEVFQGFSESVHTREEYEKVVQSQLGASDFMLFFNIDHGEWLKVFGMQRKLVRMIFGNPLIAITMMRHDLTAGLFAPVEMLLMEQESGDGSTVLYDLPSSLMRVEQNPAMREAASVLDQKVQALVSRATGVDPAKRNVATKR